MYEFVKQILTHVAFDRELFKKELTKGIKAININERALLQAWCLVSFAQYHDIIIEVFRNTQF
jgi:hypothetical protein